MLALLEHLSKELTVIIVAMLPVVELRGAIPLGVALGMTPTRALVISYLGSLIPIIPVVLLIRPLIAFTARTRYFQRFGRWLERRSMKHSRQVEQYQALGLFLFVAVPLPGTGVWSGAMIAGVLGMRLSTAFWANALGNLVAGLIITFVTKQFV